MKTKPSRTRTFNSKLAAYSATATAALLAAPAADATIQNLTTFSINGGLSFNDTAPGLSGVGFQSFTAATANHLVGFKGKFSVSYTSNPTFRDVHLFGLNNIVAGGDSGCSLSIANFSRGQNLLGNVNTHNGYAGQTLAGNDGGGFGYFNPGGGPGAHLTGYAGFKILTGTHVDYYGWLRIKVTADANGWPNQVSLVDTGDGIFGEIDSANDPNIGDFKVGDIVPVPEPSIAAIGGLSLLALGAMGVREMRRRRSAKA